MTEKRFSIKAGSSIGLSSIYTDNGKVMTQLEVLDVLIKQHETIQIFTKENEQLKSVVKEVIELLSEEVDLFSDKATEHDINAYIELKELDNKDAYYMATATKKAIKMLKEIKE